MIEKNLRWRFWILLVNNQRYLYAILCFEIFCSHHIFTGQDPPVSRTVHTNQLDPLSDQSQPRPPQSWSSTPPPTLSSTMQRARSDAAPATSPTPAILPIYSSQSIEIISGENWGPLLQPPAAEHDWIDNICDLFWGSTISLLSTVTKASVSKALRYYLMKVFSELLAYSPVVSPYREALKGFADWNGQANISLSIYQYRVEEYLSITTGTAEDVWYLEGRDHED